ncbi:hypothetical protein CEXT_605801 [Caerostris extrusa]|uniref:Uncharacterized protein n=1 Tax=Caerostris extrusa TaxID=172846 RepID=A0AAV4W5H8_CAEEX|nr:hypothetical protein CEXT_605801 [Caerostris extrusa]
MFTCAAIKVEWPGMLSSEVILFQTMRAHIYCHSHTQQACLVSWNVLEHPSYNPTFHHESFMSLVPLKRYLSGRRYLIKWKFMDIVHWFQSQLKLFHEKVTLVIQWISKVWLRRLYFEQDTLFLFVATVPFSFNLTF